jgi:diketogulonate reductase-like aldo/keto reductase
MTLSVTGQMAPDATPAREKQPARRTYGAVAGLPGDAASPDSSTAPAPEDDSRLLDAGPYVGARPFAASETVLLAGREKEADELANMVVAGTLTVVYGASGVGKTSLLNAKLPERLDPMDPGWGARTVAFGRWQPGFYQDLMEALHDVVKAGKARYIGASSMYAWQFAKALCTSRLHGWTEFVSMQDHVNLLNREEEREMLPLCADQGVAVLPWSPLARGRLTRDWNETSERQETDVFGKSLYTGAIESDRQIVERVARVAEERGVSRAQVALAWVAQKDVVTAPIVGASKSHHLDDAVAALSLKLTPEEIATLEEPYTPHAVVGFQ